MSSKEIKLGKRDIVFPWVPRLHLTRLFLLLCQRYGSNRSWKKHGEPGWRAATIQSFKRCAISSSLTLLKVKMSQKSDTAQLLRPNTLCR